MDERKPTIADLLAEVPAHALGTQGASYVGCEPSTRVLGLQMDSRCVRPGHAFVALCGETHDGHEFLPQAIDAGAGLVFVTRGKASSPTVPHVWIEDTAAALPQMAAAFHGWPARRLALAGITGTNGKTTAAHLLASIFAAAGRPHLRIGTTGNWLVDHEASAGFTTPFPLELQALLAEAVQAGATHGVMEVSSHALAQSRVEPLRYQAIGMTSFSQDHLDFHTDMEDYLAAKCLLARHHLATGGVAVAAIDDHPACHAFLAAARQGGAQTWRASRGANHSAELCVRRWSAGSQGLWAEVTTPAGVFELRSPLVGAFNLDNLLVTTGLALGLGISLGDIAAALEGCHGAPGRLTQIQVRDDVGGPTVFVDYAHTPDAVQRSIEALRPSCLGALIVVLGCGGDRDPSKRAQMGAVAHQEADVLVATSDNPRSEDPEKILDQMLTGLDLDAAQRAGSLRRIPDRAAAIAEAIAGADASDTVLIAGKGHEREQIVARGRIDFDDSAHATAALRRRRSRA